MQISAACSIFAILLAEHVCRRKAMTELKVLTQTLADHWPHPSLLKLFIQTYQ